MEPVRATPTPGLGHPRFPIPSDTGLRFGSNPSTQECKMDDLVSSILHWRACIDYVRTILVDAQTR